MKCSVFMTILLLITTVITFAQTGSEWASGAIIGVTYLDLDEDKKLSYGDVPVSDVGVHAYEDINANGIIDEADLYLTSVRSDETGQYNIGVFPSDYRSAKFEVNNSTDDAVQNEPGGQMVLDGSQESGVREIGLRFNDIQIPQFATILGATLKLTSASTTETRIEVIVSGEAADHATTFTEEDYNIWLRPRTMNATEWLSDGIVEEGEVLKIKGIQDIISEITSRAGWSSGNSIVLFASDFDGEIYTFDGGFAPKLEITYLDHTMNEVTYLLDVELADVSNTATPSTPITRSVTLTRDDVTATDINFGFLDGTILSDITDALGQAEINVYPNPTFGQVNLDLNGSVKPGDYTITVFDLKGGVAAQQSLYLDQPTTLDYNLAPLARGTYIMEIATGSDRITQKVVLQ